MKFPIRLLALFLGFSLLILPACLTIEEEIFFNSDGSGTYVNRIDMSGMIDMIMMMSPDSVREQMSSNPDAFLDSLLGSQEMGASLAQMTDAYNQMEGISGAAHEIKKGVLRIQFNFASLEALNRANEGVEQGLQGMGLGAPLFVMQKGRLTRNVKDASEEIEQMMEDPDMEMMKMLMGDATYTTRYHLPGSVKKYSNPAASLADDGSTVVLEVRLLDLMDDPSLLTNEIRYKK